MASRSLALQRRLAQPMFQQKRSDDEAIYNLIGSRRQQTEETNDLLSMLMSARDEETGQQMDDKLLRDEVATLMLAGHETTANALSWTLIPTRTLDGNI